MLRKSTATRTTLTEEWQAKQEDVDWMHAPLMADYVNRLVSGRGLDDDGHWAKYALERHLAPLAERRGSGLSMLSLACGSGHIEHFLLSQVGWPVSRFVGLEYDSELLKTARKTFGALDCESDFHFFDFNKLNKTFGRFDVVFACHSLHHCGDLEGLMTFINDSLAEDGMVLGIDFFGPTRFQVEHEVFEEIQTLFRFLPPRLRRNLSLPDGIIEDKIRRPTIEEVRQADPSESVRSSDLRTLLFATFPVLDRRPMGGTLLRWLLQNRAGNFDPANEDDLCIIQLLQYVERKLIANREIRSDDLFFVLGASDSL